MPRSGVLSVRRYRDYDYQYPSKSRYVSILPGDDVDDSKVLEDVYVLSKITSIIENISVVPTNESYASMRVLVKQ